GRFARAVRRSSRACLSSHCSRPDELRPTPPTIYGRSRFLLKTSPEKVNASLPGKLLPYNKTSIYNFRPFYPFIWNLPGLEMAESSGKRPTPVQRRPAPEIGSLPLYRCQVGGLARDRDVD